MTRILAINDYYLPGFRGGSFRALATIVERMGRRYDFSIVTGDRDVGQSEPYAGIAAGEWNVVGPARVRYLQPREWRSSVLRGLVDEVRPDLLFVFSVFSPLSIRLLWLRRRGLVRVPVLLAPEGEFSLGALAQKPWKKRTFLALARGLGLYRGLSWKATSQLEVEDIQRAMGTSARIFLSPSLPPDGPAVRGTPPVRVGKTAGRAHFVYLSRITPKKNLHFVLERLNALEGVVTFDIVGPIDDARYWALCLQRIEALGPHVRVRHLGDVAHEQVSDEIARRHVLVLPTLGENFGFVVFEALAAGRPVLISDITPWRDLTPAGVGWDLPLSDSMAWQRALQRVVDMDDAEFQRMCQAAWQYARDYALSPELDTALMSAFDESINRSIDPSIN